MLSFDALPCPGMLDQDSAHGPGSSDLEHFRISGLPCLIWFHVSKKRFMNEGRWLERVIAPFAAHHSTSHITQLEIQALVKGECRLLVGDHSTTFPYDFPARRNQAKNPQRWQQQDI